MSAPRYLDIHILQTMPFANLNRDDLGSPKSLVYGGATRTRVSSQCWKRAVRLDVERVIGDPAVRTRRVPAEVAERLERRGWSPEAATAAGIQVALSANKKEGLKLEDKGGTSVLLYLPKAALDSLADLSEEHREAIEHTVGVKKPKPVLPVEKVGELLSERNGVINLFGRMLAELPGAGVDGVVQVAHAFTTHEVASEVDFFTAVDDCLPPDAVGSGHMNSAEFSAGVFYRYANLDLVSLRANLGGDAQMAEELTRGFLTAFISSLPTGKQTSSAANTLPDLVHIAVRADRPISYAAAFEAPIRPENGLAGPSRSALSHHAGRLEKLWGDEGVVHRAYACVDEKPLEWLGQSVDSFSDLVTGAVAASYPGDSR
ncbi:type I-E CRISPR-associated protein Cas7/Cse4/CasC [Acrocarpospora phusangensis]|uniref:Type I-E CRISPR-associated protein Cas7/Cse4/CasC n=1 Tax=Acrocarpospora phusangensis TaxID=1070424 RepID=A0A919QNN9_9ACTN|nr:type I-E CRISPR-associated protein Cas7/Cse4/CasC [Acrocarpospora phusangensis]GIH29590.1 type I-E CRISPR-associated protein Cas7/Cse4/CasC [Acrocarpospora phusangensis]